MYTSWPKVWKRSASSSLPLNNHCLSMVIVGIFKTSYGQVVKSIQTKIWPNNVEKGFDWFVEDSSVKSIQTKIWSSCCSLKARWSIVRWAWEEGTYARAQSLGVAAHCITIYLFVCFCIFVLVFVCYKVSMWKSNIYIYMRAHSNNIHLDGCGCKLYFHVLPFVYLCICVLYGEHVKKQQCAHTLFKIHQLELLSIYFCISL